jgi:AcrR family transcriptional regulator
MTTTTTPWRARTPQHERVEATQRKIIDSALHLLRNEGFKSATLQAIARGANVSMGALQHYFESRDALMQRLVDEVMEPLSDQGSVWPDKTLPLRERAEEFVSRAWTHIFGAPNYLAAWSMFFGCKSTPALFERIDAHRGEVDQIFYARFLDVFPELKERHPHPQGVAVVVFSSLRGAGVLELFSVDPAEKEGSLQALVELIVHACGGAASR